MDTKPDQQRHDKPNMNLIELYDSLPFSNEGKEKTFVAVPIPHFSSFRIARNFEGFPVLLIAVVYGTHANVFKNFRLKYLQVEQNVECKITENGKSIFKLLTVISFISNDRYLQELFLRISETLIKSLNNQPTQSQVIDLLNKFVELFRSLSDTPTNTVHGLWTELFLIDSCKNPKLVLDYWHNLPEEKFDFNSGIEKIEVKSNSNFERIHTFSSEQLNPPIGTKVLVASIFIRYNSNGQSIQQLIESITSKIENDILLTEKLDRMILKTLGNSLEECIKIKFDYTIAKDSLLFYNQQDISKIERIHIPNQVSHINYRSDLTNIKPISLSVMKDCGELFKSI